MECILKALTVIDFWFGTANVDFDQQRDLLLIVGSKLQHQR